MYFSRLYHHQSIYTIVIIALRNIFERFNLKACLNVIASGHLNDFNSPDDYHINERGDFNDWNGAIHRTMMGQLDFEEAYSSLHGGPAKTYPARFPALAMDRIYFRNLQLIDADLLSGKAWQRLSDHCGLYARFARPVEPVPGSQTLPANLFPASNGP